MNECNRVVVVTPPVQSNEIEKDELKNLEQKLSQCMAENAKMGSIIAEMEKKSKAANDSFSKIITNKDESISLLMSIADDDNIGNK